MRWSWAHSHWKDLQIHCNFYIDHVLPLRCVKWYQPINSIHFPSNLKRENTGILVKTYPHLIKCVRTFKLTRLLRRIKFMWHGLLTSSPCQPKLRTAHDRPQIVRRPTSGSLIKPHNRFLRHLPKHIGHRMTFRWPNIAPAIIGLNSRKHEHAPRMS